MPIYLKKYLIIILICIITFFLDQYTKNSVLQLLYFKNIQTFKVTSFLNFTETWNNGISFGLLSNYHLPVIFLIGIAFIIMILLLLFMKNIYPILQGMILGGSFGNIKDRTLFGKVFDFIDFHVYNWHYPTFNLADTFIVCSITIIFIKEIFSPPKI